jgi:16S rRNA (cytosine967-C5)-methyltransferase
LGGLAAEDIGIRQSHPDLLVQRWQHSYGKQATAELCRWNNRRARVILCPNPVRIGVQGLLNSLEEAGIAAGPHPAAPEVFIRLDHGTRVAGVPGYKEGHFSVQDPSTHEAVKLLDPQPGECVLDACAAPGGKTVLIAEHMQDTGRIVAMDLYRDRLGRLETNIERMGFGSVETLQGNAADAEDLQAAAARGLFDRILLDVPCSNTGVLQRRPDARWRFSEERLRQLVRLQHKLLNSVTTVLAPGGTLVYSTCSLEREENRDLVEAWLREHPGFNCVSSVGLFPPESGTDGIYAAALRSDK